MDWAETNARPDEKQLSAGISCVVYKRFDDNKYATNLAK